MYMLIAVGVGLIVLAGFYFGTGLSGRRRESGAFAFIWVWLIAALLNSAVGVSRAGIPLVNEIGAFIPIFGIPALVAFLLSRGSPER